MFKKISDNISANTVIDSPRCTTDDVMRALRKTLDDLEKVRSDHVEEAFLRTTDDVMRAFRKTLDNLEKVRSDHAEEASRQREISASALDKAIAAESEAKRAEQVAEELTAIVAA